MLCKCALHKIWFQSAAALQLTVTPAPALALLMAACSLVLQAVLVLQSIAHIRAGLPRPHPARTSCRCEMHSEHIMC